MERQPILFELMDRQKSMMSRHLEPVEERPPPPPPPKPQSPYRKRVVLDPYASSDNEDYYNDDPIANNADSPTERDTDRGTGFNKPMMKQFQFPKVGHESDSSIRSYDSEEENSVSGQTDDIERRSETPKPGRTDSPESRPTAVFSSISESSDRDSPAASVFRSSRNASPESGIRKKTFGGLENVLNKIKQKQLTVPGSLRGKGSDTESKLPSRAKSGYPPSDSEDSCASSVCFKPSKRKGLARRVHERSMYTYEDDEDDEDDEESSPVAETVGDPKDTDCGLDNDQPGNRGSTSSSFTSGTPESAPTPEPEPVVHKSPPSQPRARAAMQMPSANLTNKSLSQVTASSRFDSFQARNTPDGGIMACRYCPFTKPMGPGCMVAIRKHEQCHFAKGTYKCHCCTFSTININTFRSHQQLHVDAGDCTEESMRNNGPKRRRARKQMPKASLPKPERGISPSTQELLKNKLSHGSGSEEGPVDDIDNQEVPRSKHGSRPGDDYSHNQNDNPRRSQSSMISKVYSSMTDTRPDQMSNYPINNQVQNQYQSNDSFNFRYNNYSSSGSWRGYNPNQSPGACEKPGSDMHHPAQNQMYPTHGNESWQNNNMPPGYQNTPNYYGQRNPRYNYTDSNPNGIPQCSPGPQGYNNLSPNSYRSMNGGYYMNNGTNNYNANNAYRNSSQSNYPSNRTNAYRNSTPVNYGHPGYTNLSPTGYNLSPGSGHYQENNPWSQQYPARQPTDYRQQVPNYHNYPNSYPGNDCNMASVQKQHSMYPSRENLHSPDSGHSNYSGPMYGPRHFSNYAGNAPNDIRNKVNTPKSPSPVPYEPATTPVSSASPSSHHEDEAMDLSSQKAGIDGEDDGDLDASVRSRMKADALDLTKHQDKGRVDSSAEYYHSETQPFESNSVLMGKSSRDMLSSMNGVIGPLDESPDNITWDLSSVRASLKKSGINAPVKKITRKYKVKASYKTKVHCCQFCPFKSGGNLSSKAVVAKHQKCHATKRRYACDLCNYNTDCSKNIRLHIELHPKGDANILINGKPAVLRKRKVRVKANMSAKKSAKIFQNADGSVIPAPKLQTVPDIDSAPNNMAEENTEQSPPSFGDQGDDKPTMCSSEKNMGSQTPQEDVPSVEDLPTHDFMDEEQPDVSKQKLKSGKGERTPKRGSSRPVEIIKCLYCPLTVTTVSPAARYNLKRHQQCHSIKGRFTCTKCSYSAQYMDHMKRHRLLHIKEDGIAPPIRQGKRLLHSKTTASAAASKCDDEVDDFSGDDNDEIEDEEGDAEQISGEQHIENIGDELEKVDSSEIAGLPEEKEMTGLNSQSKLDEAAMDENDHIRENVEKSAKAEPVVKGKAGRPKMKKTKKKSGVRKPGLSEPVVSTKCRYCPFSTCSANARINMSRHERAHFMRGTFMCEICNFGCFVEWRLRKHKQLHEKFDQKSATVLEDDKKESDPLPDDRVKDEAEISSVPTNAATETTADMDASKENTVDDDIPKVSQNSETKDVSNSHEADNGHIENQSLVSEENKLTENLNQKPVEQIPENAPAKIAKVRRKRKKKRVTLNIRKKQSKARELGLVGRGGYLKKIPPVPSPTDHVAAEDDTVKQTKYSELPEEPAACDGSSVIHSDDKPLETEVEKRIDKAGLKEDGNKDEENEQQKIDVKQNEQDSNEGVLSAEKRLYNSIEGDKEAHETDSISCASVNDSSNMLDSPELPDLDNDIKETVTIDTAQKRYKTNQDDKSDLPENKSLKAQSVFAFTENDASDFENDVKTSNRPFIRKKFFGNRFKKPLSIAPKQQRLSCMHCPFQVSSPNNAARHHLTLHEQCHYKKSKYKCHHCTFTGKSPSSIHKHSQVHKPNYNPNPIGAPIRKPTVPNKSSGERGMPESKSERSESGVDTISAEEVTPMAEQSRGTEDVPVVKSHLTKISQELNFESDKIVNDQTENNFAMRKDGKDFNDKILEPSEIASRASQPIESTVSTDALILGAASRSESPNAKSILKRKLLGKRKKPGPKPKGNRLMKSSLPDSLRELSDRVDPAEIYNITNVDDDEQMVPGPDDKCRKVSTNNNKKIDPVSILKPMKAPYQEHPPSKADKLTKDKESRHILKEKYDATITGPHIHRLSQEQASENIRKEKSGATVAEHRLCNGIVTKDTVLGEDVKIPGPGVGLGHSLEKTSEQGIKTLVGANKLPLTQAEGQPEVNKKSMHVDHMYTKVASKVAPVRHNTRRSPKAKLKMAMILEAERNGGIGMDPSHLGYITSDTKPSMFVKPTAKRVPKPKSPKSKPPPPEMVPRLVIRYKCGECSFNCCDTKSLEHHVATCHQTPDGVSSKALSNIEIKVEHIIPTPTVKPAKQKSVLSHHSMSPHATSATGPLWDQISATGDSNKHIPKPEKRVKLGINRAIKTAPGVKAKVGGPHIAGSPSKSTTLTDTLEELRTSMPGLPNKEPDMIFTVRAPKKASPSSKRMLEIPADLWKVDGQFRCQWCDFVCKREHYFKIHLYCHQRRRAKHRCKRCGYGATRPAFLEQHIRQHHLPEGGNVSNAEPKDLFYAVRERLWDRGLDERVLVQLAGPKAEVPPSFVMPEPSPEVAPPSSPRDGSPRKSGVKGKKRRWNSALPAGTVVEEAAEPKLRCPFCPFATSSVEVQAQHANKHRKVERFSCPYCTYSTRTRVYLEKHVKLHFTAPVQSTALEHLPVVCNHFDMAKQMEIKDQAHCAEPKEDAVAIPKQIETFSCRYCGLEMDKEKLESHEYRHLVGCGYLHHKPDVPTEL